MKSVRDLDAAAVRGVVFDIDDTVTRNGVVEPAAYSAMHRIAEAGLTLVAVTGRPLGWTDVLARLWPVGLAVGENGAGWARVEGHRFEEGYFCEESERIQHRALLDRIRTEVARVMPNVRVSTDDGARRCDLAFDVGESVRLPEDDVRALVALIEGMGARTSVSTVHAHAIPGPWDKAAGVRHALSEALQVRLDDELDQWVFIGDSGNDAAAFSYFTTTVGVANVREHLDRLPTAPRFVTDADRGIGFAELTAHLLDGRG